MSEYDEIFDALEDDETSGGGSEFSINDDNLADWAIGKIATEKSECDRLIRACEYKISIFEEKIIKYRKRFENKTGYLRSKLMEYFDGVPHKATKTQETYKLPSGTLKRKLSKQDYVHDDEVLTKWLKDNIPDLIVEKPMWGEVKKLLQISDGNAVIAETGELIEGVTIAEKPSEFSVVLDAVVNS